VQLFAMAIGRWATISTRLIIKDLPGRLRGSFVAGQTRRVPVAALRRTPTV
jgi:hypothetical protein